MKKQHKKGRPPSENPMVHTAVMLPQDLLERLRRDADATDRGVSAEIRRRIQLTYDQEALPTKTRELLDEIEQVAVSLEEPWQDNRFAFDVFKAAIIERLARHEPSSEAAGPTGRLQAKYGKDAKPEIYWPNISGRYRHFSQIEIAYCTSE